MVRLTQLASCAGCAAKMRPGTLSAMLRRLPRVRDARALVGFETNDDAAVYRLSPTQAIVETADFFPPVLDDPYAYGQVAAANAMSDIWAMGARPLFALNLVGFPKTLPNTVLHRILKGGADKAREAGIPILGGHSIQSPEPLYGMAVTGVVHPRRALTNAGARAGDLLVLTKPLGTGIATTALKRGVAPRALLRAVTRQMSELNQRAGEAFAAHAGDVHALTDVTGFGFLGHALEMAMGARLRLRVALERVPLMAGVAALAEAGVVPGGTISNLAHVAPRVSFPEHLPLGARHVLADAQTNGGLLAAVPPRAQRRVARELGRRRVDAFWLGRFERGSVGIVVE